MTTTSQRVREGYARVLGEPVGEYRFEQEGGIRVSVLKHEPSPSTGDVTLYTTAGVSDLVQPGWGPGHRFELSIGLLPEADQVAPALAWLGIIPLLSGNPLAPGHTWRSEEPVVPGYDFGGFLVLESGEPVVPPIVLDDVHISVLMVWPLFNDELDYVRERGHEALWDSMEDAMVPIWDPGRASAFRDTARS